MNFKEHDRIVKLCSEKDGYPPSTVGIIVIFILVQTFVKLNFGITMKIL